MVDGPASLEAEKKVGSGQTAIEVVGPVGADEHQPRPLEQRQSLKDRGTLGVAPVEIFEYEYGRPGARRRKQEVGASALAIVHRRQTTVERGSHHVEGAPERAGVGLSGHDPEPGTAGKKLPE